MTTHRQVPVRLYGAFRQTHTGSTLTVAVADDATVADLRAALHAVLPGDSARALLKASAFATDTEVLDEDQPVPEREVSILPPVCGG
ncbi:MAG: MoaD/ThiS family protein [Wenzhouxiangella sp.]